MATGYNHPLSQPIKLGEFVGFHTFNRNAIRDEPATLAKGAPADWRTIFYYEKGEVILFVEHDGGTYRYQTSFYADLGEVLEGVVE